MNSNPIARTSSQGLVAETPALKCCWMLAGVVSYKLCDQRYECEHCSFDEAMRNRPLRLPAGTPVGYHLSVGPVTESLLFHEKHVWARLESGGRVRTGLDDFGRRLSGRIYCIQLPRPGMRLEAGGPAWTIVHHEGEISLASPVSGVVDEVNEQLRHHPSLVNEDPYGEGWVMVLTPADLVKDLGSLRFGSETARWIAAESERLGRELAQATGSPPTLMDGGRLMTDLHEAIPAEVRPRILEHFLSAQNIRPSDTGQAQTAGESEGR